MSPRLQSSSILYPVMNNWIIFLWSAARVDKWFAKVEMRRERGVMNTGHQIDITNPRPGQMFAIPGFETYSNLLKTMLSVGLRSSCLVLRVLTGLMPGPVSPVTCHAVYLRIFICAFVCLCICVFVYLCICVFVYLCICICICIWWSWWSVTVVGDK